LHNLLKLTVPLYVRAQPDWWLSAIGADAGSKVFLDGAVAGEGSQRS